MDSLTSRWHPERGCCGVKGSAEKKKKSWILLESCGFSWLIYPYCLPQQEKHKKGWRRTSTMGEALTLCRRCCRQAGGTSKTEGDRTVGVHAEEGGTFFEAKTVRRVRWDKKNMEGSRCHWKHPAEEPGTAPTTSRGSSPPGRNHKAWGREDAVLHKPVQWEESVCWGILWCSVAMYPHPPWQKLVIHTPEVGLLDFLSIP